MRCSRMIKMKPWLPWPLGSMCGSSRRVFPETPEIPETVPVAPVVHWPVEVETYGLMLRTNYGPFIVLRSESAKQKRKRVVAPPLVDLGVLLEAARSSKPLSNLATAGRLLGYTEWASHRLSQDPSVCSAKQVVAAEAIASRHGLDEALHVGAAAAGGHTWAFDEAWISEYSREDRFASIGIAMQTLRRDSIVPQERQKLSGSSPVRKRASLPSAVRMALWNKYFGREAGVGECYCCREKIYQQAFECGHVLAAAKGGSDAIDNLRPLCSVCNRSQGDDHMDDFISVYFPHSETRKGYGHGHEHEHEPPREPREPRVRLRARRTGVSPMIVD